MACWLGTRPSRSQDELVSGMRPQKGIGTTSSQGAAAGPEQYGLCALDSHRSVIMWFYALQKVSTHKQSL